jgi:hypothetical protein
MGSVVIDSMVHGITLWRVFFFFFYELILGVKQKRAGLDFWTVLILQLILGIPETFVESLPCLDHFDSLTRK